MPMPGTQEIRKPLLEAFRGEAPRKFIISEILELIAEYFSINLNDLSSGDKNILKSRINEAKSDLKRYRYIYNPSGSTYMITNAGTNILEDDPEIITDEYLKAMRKKKLPSPAPIQEILPAVKETETLSEESPAVDEPDTLPEDLPAVEPDTLPEELPAGEADTLTEELPAGDEPDTLPEDLPLDETDTLPEDLPAVEPDTLTEESPLDEPDTLTEESPAGDENDTLTEELPVDVETDTLTEESPAGDENDTLTEELPVGDEADTLTEDLPAGDEPDTLTEDLPAGDEADTLTEDLPAGDEPDTLTEESPVDEPDTLTEELPADDEPDMLTEELPAGDEADTLTEELPADVETDTLTEESPAVEPDTLTEESSDDEIPSPETEEDIPDIILDDEPEENLDTEEVQTDTMPEDLYSPDQEEAREDFSPDPEEEEESYDPSLIAAAMSSSTIDDAIARHNSELADSLLMKTAGLPSDRFEMLVIDLLSKMGYFAFQTARYTTESSGSDMIHGVILDNKTGANIYIQARKLSPGRTVGKADIQEFIDELSDKGGKGIYATTASFSENAKILANDERLMLIDGERLANLMIANNFCVSVEKVYEIKAIDSESFSEYE